MTTEHEGGEEASLEVLESWVWALSQDASSRPYSEWEDVDLCKQVLSCCDEPADLLLVVHELQFRPAIPAAFKGAIIQYFMEHLFEADAGETASAAEQVVPKTESPSWGFPKIDIYEFRKQSLVKAKHNWQEVGLLGLSGYVVGKTKGLTKDERRRILNWVFIKDDLKDMHDKEMTEEWGGPLSSNRLKKMANSIAAFANGKVGMDKDYSVAIAHWKEDLEYLRVTFYEKWEYGWPWPSAEF